MFFSSLAGFAFAKLQFRGRSWLFLAMLGTMMMPSLLGFFPLFIIMSRLNWVNTDQSVIIPGVASAFGIFFMRYYIREVPDELIDAAGIDGSSDCMIYQLIILPLIKPGLAALGIMNFVGSWNNFFWPLIVLRSNNMYTVVLAVASLPAANFNTPRGAIMAGIVVAVVLLIIFFLVFQREFIAGVMRVGLQG